MSPGRLMLALALLPACIGLSSPPEVESPRLESTDEQMGPAPSLVRLEQEIVAAANRLRGDPAGFVAELRRYRGFIDGNLVRFPGRERPVIAREGTAAVDEAIAVLEQVEPLPELSVSAGLTRAARAHAADIGRSGHIAHTGSDGSHPHQRMARFGRLIGYSAENINTRHRRGLWAVIDLFVDDGIPGRGHRLNLLGAGYRFIGVGCAPHVEYDIVCVMDLAEGYVD